MRRGSAGATAAAGFVDGNGMKVTRGEKRVPNAAVLVRYLSFERRLVLFGIRKMVYESFERSEKHAARIDAGGPRGGGARFHI